MNKVYYEVKHAYDTKQKIRFEVEIVSSKNVFGRKVCKIKPVNGEGEMNVNDESLIVKK